MRAVGLAEAGINHSQMIRTAGEPTSSRLRSSLCRYHQGSDVCYLGLADEKKAVAFERYLQSGSGKAFVKRHFLSFLRAHTPTDCDGN